MAEFAIIVRRRDSGKAEAFVIDFKEGAAGFTKWVKQLPDDFELVDAGGQFTTGGGVLPAPLYQMHTKANAFAFFMGESTYMAAWKLTDSQWYFMKADLEESQKEEGRIGRPANPIRPLQTWRMWAKKQGAII